MPIIGTTQKMSTLKTSTLNASTLKTPGLIMSRHQNIKELKRKGTQNVNA